MAHWINEETEVKVLAPYNSSTPFKARRVIDQIRGKSLEEALTILRFMPQGVAVDLYKLAENALNAARQKASQDSRTLNEKTIMISEVYADQGPTLKRFLPAPRGRAHRINKTSCHLVMVVDLGEA
jgi:large subunit ribosomal protein L22